jgi:haloacetate dehalogenase
LSEDRDSVAPASSNRGRIQGLEYSTVPIRGADYLVGTAGNGPPVLLLHGFPQTHYCWRRVVPALVEEHTVVLTDLRGYGASSAPAGGSQGEGYTKRELASDLVELLDALEIPSAAVVGHDRGARVAYRLALDHPDRVDRLAVLNVVPTLDQFERMAAGPSLGYWTWFLLAQPAPFPERLIAAEREHVLRFVFESWTEDPAAIDSDAFDAYLGALEEATIAAMCADFRASFFLDQEHDLADRRAGRKIGCPVLVLTGAAETQLADAPAVWRGWAADVRAGIVPGGHFNPEEAPQEVAAALKTLLTS